jgi:hypothetical protein
MISSPSACATQPATAIIGGGRFRAGLHQPADVRIDLLGRLLADVAGVEHDEVGVLALGAARMPWSASSSAMRSPS